MGQDNIAAPNQSARLPDTVRYLIDACEGTDFTVEIVDSFSSYLVRVGSRGRFFYSGAGTLAAYPLNSATAQSLATDKAHSYQVLRRAGIAVPAGEHFFLARAYAALRPPGRELGDALAWATARGFPLFVKPNDGSRGDFATVITDADDLIHHLNAIATRHLIALIQEVLVGDEYRAFLVDGEVQFAHQRFAPCLVGDGHRTVGELIEQTNQALASHGLTPLDPAGGYFLTQLAAAGLTLGAVLPAGVPLHHDARRNLSSGGRFGPLIEPIPPATAAWLKRVAEALQLRVCAIDLIARGRFDQPETFVALEVNGNPSLTVLEKIGRQDRIRVIWRRVIETWEREQG